MPHVPLVAVTESVQHRITSGLLEGFSQWWHLPALVLGAVLLAGASLAIYRRDAAELPRGVAALLVALRLAALAALLRRFVEPDPREAAAGRPSIIVSPHSSTRLVVGGDSGRAPATESASIAGRLAP